MFAEVLVIYRDTMKVKNAELEQMFREKMEFNELSAAELERFRVAVEPARSISRDKSGAEYADKIFQILAENEKAYREKLGK